MCLAIPMQIVAIDGFNALCEAKGIQRDASLFMLQHDTIKLHDYVLIHVGYAIQKISEADAITAWQVYDEMLALEQQNAEKMMSQIDDL